MSGEERKKEAEPWRENRHGEMKRKRCLRGNGTGKKKPLRVRAEEMERTGEMGERMFEIKRKQSKGRDGWIDNMKQQQRDERGVRARSWRERRETVKSHRKMRGVSEMEDGGVQ